MHPNPYTKNLANQLPPSKYQMLHFKCEWKWEKL